MKTILVPIDFSPVTNVVLTAATTLARGCNGRITLVHVVQPPSLVPEYGGMLECVVPLMATAEKAAQRLLAHWQKKLKGMHRLAPKTIQLDGSPTSEILGQAEKLKADYIVMGSHGHTAFYDLLIGSTTSGVLRRANCPVVVVPSRAKPASRGAN
jgi:nucleotide-binding universal stress UspA family protein